VPWKGAYESTQILGGKKRFVLGASGHIAGVINPRSRRSAATGRTRSCRTPPTTGSRGATEHPGSWWGDWSKWLGTFGGAMVPAPKTPGSRAYKAIEPAPDAT
jgi:polyhydroxyalkanoate synthase